MYQPETIDSRQFRVMGTAERPEFVFIDSSRVDECVEFALEKDLGIAVAPLSGFLSRDLSFLKRFSSIVRLAILDAEMIDITAVNSLERLRYLQISGKASQSVLLKNFPVIEELRVQWWAKLSFEGQHSCLQTLSLRKFAGRRGLGGIPGMPSLSRLNLVQSSMSSIAGIDQFPSLRELKMTDLPKVASVAPLASTFDRAGLATLELTKCGSISDHYRIGSITSLTRLALNRCGEIESLRFLDRLPLLKSFSFVGTTIRDGDLSPCLRLQFVGFEDKPQYSHKSFEFKTEMPDSGVQG